MIHHLSIAARDPQHVAGVLAEIMGGKAVPFPPNPGSFFALQLDEHGSGVEVYPAGTELRAGRRGRRWLCQKTSRASLRPTHFALSVTTDGRPRLKLSPSAKAGSASIATAARSM